MKFLLISGAGDGLGLALRLKEEGNEVAVWIREGRCKQNYLGLLQHIDKWESFLDRDTYVIFDSNGGGRTADRLRARGHLVCGGSAFADQLSSDIQITAELMQQAGVRVPEYKAFTSWDRAKVYVKDKVGLTFVPSGDSTGQVEFYEGEDLLDQLEVLQQLHRGKPDFVLQRKILGPEVQTTGWFSGKVFTRPFIHTLSKYHLMNGDLGPLTRCAGSISWTSDSDPITDELLKFEDTLRENEYLGPISLVSRVNEEGVWGLRFIPRCGSEVLPTLLELSSSPIGETLSALAGGDALPRLPLKNSFASALCVSIPPFPTDKAPMEGLPIKGFTKADRSHLYFYDVMLDDKLRLVTTPAYGDIVTITGSADSIVEAFEAPYATASRARIPSKQYRTDLVNNLVTARATLEPYLKPKELPQNDSSVGVPVTSNAV